MNENYLWDKSGADPEIEDLENALAVFRYKETAAPALPAKIMAFEPKKPRKTFRFAFAAAACAAFAMIAFGIWTLIDKTEVKNNLAESVAPKIEKQSGEIPISKPDNSNAKPFENPPQIARQQIAAKRRIVSANYRPKQTTAQNVKAAKQTEVKLTDEEQYAYNRLMLALSITSSKLKEVKNKVEGNEENKTVLKNER